MNSPTTAPVTVAGAAIVVITTGTDLIALVLNLDPVIKVALSAFLTSVVVLISLAWANRHIVARVTPTGAPRLDDGSVVKVLDPATGEETGDSVIVRTSPPGSTDVPEDPSPGWSADDV